MSRPGLAVAACCAASALALGGCAATVASASLVRASTSSSAASEASSSAPPSISSTPPSSVPSTPLPATPDHSTTAPARAQPSAPDIVASGLVVRPATSTLSKGVFALGDSFLLGSRPELSAARVRVDAVVGRQFYEGIPELRAVARAGALPRNVLVHLGTNGTVTSKHCDTLIASAGPARRVFLVTVIGPRSWMAPNVKVLKACAARHRDQVVLVDWAALAAPHAGWFGPDRVHPNPTGRRHYDALLLEALREYAV